MTVFLNSKFLLLALSVSLFVCSSLAHDDFSIVGYSPEHLNSMDKLIELFESWMSRHGKTYKCIEEKLHRFEIFRDNLKHIDERNKEVNSRSAMKSSGTSTYSGDSNLSFPEEDSRLLVTSAIEMLRTCQTKDNVFMSCWTFSTVAAVEGRSPWACGGLHKEEDYPYLMEEGTCEEKKKEMETLRISGYQDVPENDEESVLKALAHQPLSVAIEASGRDFQFYSGVSLVLTLTCYNPIINTMASNLTRTTSEKF
ncbi:hypothetical protein JRO89_XS02G0002600 [Xanthoceras sorbifolium]|uniref:Uncharacterized protein n=1 Tax=Xanthoceras sorbifolium TaxID=99658 RepID=A0ABQ8IDJ2_9ROSI|nr:hypothetical protein JRO89_XS02G0002600 [Xanthoceras sorbifolium]